MVTTGAVAVFVKTPGISPIKTRLAQSLGKEAAECFYHLSVKATKSVLNQTLRQTSAITPYWAVAEEKGLSNSLWRDFDRIFQGNGELGARLCYVYSELLKKHSPVFLIGADSPQITPAHLLQAYTIYESPKQNTFVIGRTEDGGFYLFGGNTHISKEIWTNIPYSQSNTASSLCRLLEPSGHIEELPKLFDIDSVDDLKKLCHEYAGSIDLIRAQKEVIAWAEKINVSR